VLDACGRTDRVVLIGEAKASEILNTYERLMTSAVRLSSYSKCTTTPNDLIL